MKLYLDDERMSPGRDWMVLRSYRECLIIMNRDWNDIEEISLDHDLGENQQTGYDVLLYIEKRVAEGERHLPRLSLHTANTSARYKMQQAIESIGKMHAYNMCKNEVQEVYISHANNYASEFSFAILSSREIELIAKLRSLGYHRDWTAQEIIDEAKTFMRGK
jgi:hypothetical protein